MVTGQAPFPKKTNCEHLQLTGVTSGRGEGDSPAPGPLLLPYLFCILGLQASLGSGSFHLVKCMGTH